MTSAHADPLSQVVTDLTAAGFASTAESGMLSDAIRVCALLNQTDGLTAARLLSAGSGIPLNGAIEFVIITAVDLCPWTIHPYGVPSGGHEMRV